MRQDGYDNNHDEDRRANKPKRMKMMSKKKLKQFLSSMCESVDMRDDTDINAKKKYRIEEMEPIENFPRWKFSQYIRALCNLMGELENTLEKKQEIADFAFIEADVYQEACNPKSKRYNEEFTNKIQILCLRYGVNFEAIIGMSVEEYHEARLTYWKNRYCDLKDNIYSEMFSQYYDEPWLQ